MWGRKQQRWGGRVHRWGRGEPAEMFKDKRSESSPPCTHQKGMETKEGPANEIGSITENRDELPQMSSELSSDDSHGER